MDYHFHLNCSVSPISFYATTDCVKLVCSGLIEPVVVWQEYSEDLWVLIWIAERMLHA